LVGRAGAGGQASGRPRRAHGRSNRNFSSAPREGWARAGPHSRHGRVHTIQACVASQATRPSQACVTVASQATRPSQACVTVASQAARPSQACVASQSQARMEPGMRAENRPGRAGRRAAWAIVGAEGATSVPPAGRREQRASRRAEGATSVPPAGRREQRACLPPGGGSNERASRRAEGATSGPRGGWGEGRATARRRDSEESTLVGRQGGPS
jgi:hypothetical protein